ncbi:hypothetical protein [Comamonas sp. BIGb0124]|uniref:hypothetical protein n=1 Tax=Comamonas sp. BIGb0124 TaxID=2485130 RepID=UPI00131557CF|nr:hypothetical protein [Comamonas sp. BIGb0124]
MAELSQRAESQPATAPGLRSFADTAPPQNERSTMTDAEKAELEALRHRAEAA